MLEPAETVRIFQKQPTIKTISSGQTIFTTGETGNYMYGVLSGEVDILVNNKVIETIYEGDVFGIGALVVLDHTRASTAVAKTDCQLACLDRNNFLFAVQETPMFALQVMRSYSERLRTLKSAN
ncbi:MAG: cyclic nucleotide-binding domain-containing protein [Chlorogloeopsis fritschii C42_A2020_084]|jgi:CRP/FNR family transcriptional regulator, cyclic AMP receptor protein|uniref:Crp/Fnr family transcriptional regulator n=1 Tax=Chlorogloeopsis fritschii TaxID=1124 RepID=UPI001A0E7A34|nr:cyclic nucleotide-binding domain-containing protein [Chlorogloeopsis fritschii]MBF2004494.1 cyclic nucleotide-binding domain-containing protein [Chlorogloeopsis fritschii C42_A2020_084]